MDNIREFGLFLVMLLITAIIGVLIMLLIFAPLEMMSCKERYRNFKPEYGFFSGCMIEWNGQRIPDDMVKSVDIYNKTEEKK